MIQDGTQDFYNQQAELARQYRLQRPPTTMSTTENIATPEALRLATWLNEGAWHKMRLGDVEAAGRELRRQHTRIAELEAQIEALSGVQALSAAPAAKKSALRTYPNPIVPLIKPVSEQEKMRALYLASSNLMAYLGRNGAIHSDGHAADAMMDCLNDLDGGGFDETLFATSPTPPAEQTFITPETGNSVSAKGAAITSESGTPPAPQQAAPKIAPGVGNSGFDHQTAADFLNGKTVSDEAMRKFVAASRWAHDERAALSATLLAMHGVLTSREAEIAHLKKALLEAEAAPQSLSAAPAEQQAAPKAAPGEPAAHQILAITTAYEQGVGKGHQAYKSGKEITNPYDSTYRCDLAWQYGYEEGKEQAQRATKAAPQPAPAPLSEQIDQLERKLAIIGVVGAIDGHDVVRRESVLEIARRAAIAAQGGSK